MRLNERLLLPLLFVSFVVGVANIDTLHVIRSEIDNILDAPPFSHGIWGVSVRSLLKGDLLYERNGGTLLLPASNMKLVTLAVAADTLGWDFRYPTSVFAGGRVSNGILDGDLLVVGSGDPSTSDFDGVAETLVRQGLHGVTGRIVGDDRAFHGSRLGFGWSWDDLPEDYAAGIGALQFNENRVEISITASHTEGALAGVTVSPDGSGLLVDCAVRTGAAGTHADVISTRDPGTDRVLVSGTVPLGGTTVTIAAAVANPTHYYVAELRRALIAHGIDVNGNAVDISDAPDAQRPTGRALVELSSAPLRELAVRLMKSSQNQYAETLLKTLGVRAGFGTWDAGRNIAATTLRRWGIAPSEIVIADGSGLSRYGYVTAGALAKILAHVYADPALRDPFIASLPIAGRDGTLASRMQGTPAEGNVRAKTGSMTRVRALSGYMKTANGEPLAFSIIANNYAVPANTVDRATDAILIALIRFSR